MANHQPNVLIFLPHDLGDTLGCYGHATVRSPRLDGLAAQGVRFANYFTPAPECTPSRGCMFTGLYTHQNGLMGLSNFGWELVPEAPHLAQRFREGGYQTYLFGLQHETAKPPTALGYEHVAAQQDRSVGAVCGELRDFLRSEAARGETPWFACAGFFDVHRPWRTEPTFTPEEVAVPPYLPDTPVVREELARFHQNILDMDAAVGGALDALDAAGLREDTLVIFTTDHGCGFPRAKATFYDPGVHLPLIMHWPGRIDGGAVYPQLQSNIDLTPTLLELCGLPAPEGIAGRSMAPLLRGETREGRDAVFGSLQYDVSYDPMHYVRTDRYKYIRSFAVTPEEAAGADPEVLATHAAGQWVRVDDFDVMASKTWQSLAGDWPKPPPEELYDLQADPVEQHNLAGDPAYGEVLADMRRRLREMMERTNSPLLHGHVPPTPEQRQAAARYQPGGPMYREIRT